MITRNIILSSMVFLLATFLLVPMGEQQAANSQKEPAFTPLEEEEELFNGRIKDDQTTTDVIQLSFFGHTKIGGLRRDDDDSVTTLNLANIASIKIQQQMYTSTKYPDKDFALIQKTALDGTVTEGLLLPRQVIICGIEKKTGDEKAWYLSKIDELIIQAASPAQPDEPKETQAKQEQKTPSVPATTTNTSIPSNSSSPSSGSLPETSTDRTIATVKNQYKDFHVKIEEKDPEVINQKKTVIQAITNLFSAIIEVIKALFNFVRGLFW